MQRSVSTSRNDEYADGAEPSRTPRRGRTPRSREYRPKQDADAWVQRIALPALEAKEGGVLCSLDRIEKLQIGQRVPRLTSPRSIKACLDLGVDPKQLAPVSIDGYRDDQVDAQIWMLRYQHAQDLRDSLMVKLCALRLSYDAEAIAKQFRPSTGAGSNAEVLAAESTTEQRATERVERLQEKQRKLASTRVEALNESVQMQKSLEGKIGRVDDMLERRQEARRLTENTRVNTLLLSSMQQSAAVREADLEEAYEAGEHFRIEQEKLAAARRREAQQRQEVKESVVRNAEKEREWRRRHQAVVAEQAAVADASRRTIEAGERRRQKLKKVRDAERAEAMAATAAEFQQRLNKAKSVAESQQGGQRDMLLEREVKASLRRKAMTVERGQELELERARNKEKEEIRQQIKKEADRTQEERLSRIVSEADEAARKLEELKVAQELKRQLTLTERHLSVGDRKMRTEMQQKQGALHRFTLKQKIDRDDVRAEYIKDSKERMRRRAVQSNIDAAMAQTKQAEESEKLLHATFRTQAMPKTKRGVGALGTTL